MSQQPVYCRYYPTPRPARPGVRGSLVTSRPHPPPHFFSFFLCRCPQRRLFLPLPPATDSCIKCACVRSLCVSVTRSMIFFLFFHWSFLSVFMFFSLLFFALQTLDHVVLIDGVVAWVLRVLLSSQCLLPETNIPALILS